MFKSAVTVVALILTFNVIFGCTAENDVQSDPPLIHAAASLVDVLIEIQVQYETDTGSEVRFNFAGSNLIANQIISGAPADAVVLAGRTPIDKLDAADRVSETQTMQILTNALVAVRPVTSTPGHTEIGQLIGVGKIAMPDPATAPAGEYFEAALRELDLLDRLEQQIVPTLDVRAALAAAASGNVAYALVYRTDAITSHDVEIAFNIETDSDETKPKYFAAPIDGDTFAVDFLNYLQSPVARSIFTKHGFTY